MNCFDSALDKLGRSVFFDSGFSDLRGPGVWKFNNSLLDDEYFCLDISDLIEQFLAFWHCFASQRDFWESLKSDIKLTAIAFSRRKHRLLSSQKVFLTNRLALGDVSASPEILTSEAALQSLLDSELEGSKIRSSVKWAEEGESPSGFFLGLENERHEKGSVSSVFDAEGQEVFSLPDMIQAHKHFYSSPFSEEPIDPVAQSHLFEHDTRRLSDAERESCEGLFSLNEASEAPRLSNRNKTPGSDSLTVEFYSAFWSLLGPLLVDMFNESLAHRELCDSMKSSVTRLAPKKDDRRNLKNWRSISLLNVDCKICSKALSFRLCKVLGSIVDPDQTCSVPGRSISSNLALLRDTLDFIERTGETGILVSLDQEKAFDRVNRSFLMNLLEHFGFGPSFCSWIFTLYKGAYMHILVNFLSDPVPLLRGVRQGDALSPMIYVLFVEVLASHIRDSPAIEGFLLPGAGGVQFKVRQFADDTTAFVKNDSSLFSLFDAIGLERGSGAKLNLSKTEAMWLGAWKDRLDEPLGLSWVRKTKTLGVFFGTVDVERDNWEPRLSKLDKTLSRWKSQSLSFIGKVLILNISALSKLLYVLRVLVPPKWVYSKLNSLIWPFLCRARLETVARKSLICSVDSGGLGLKDFSCQGHALRLAALVTSVSDSSFKCFYLAKYFCGSVLAPLRPEWAGLRDNLTPSAACPTAFYASVLSSFRATDLPPGFTYTSRAFYKVLLENFCTIPIFPVLWSGFVPSRFSLSRHWGLIRDSFTENYKNDLAWLITLHAVKVRHSLHTWGYIRSPRCALCARLETIDRFVPMLSALLSAPLVSNCPFVFF